MPPQHTPWASSNLQFQTSSNSYSPSHIPPLKAHFCARKVDQETTSFQGNHNLNAPVIPLIIGIVCVHYCRPSWVMGSQTALLRAWNLSNHSVDLIKLRPIFPTAIMVSEQNNVEATTSILHYVLKTKHFLNLKWLWGDSWLQRESPWFGSFVTAVEIWFSSETNYRTWCTITR